MSLFTQVALFAGGFVLCFAIMIAYVMKSNDSVDPPLPSDTDSSFFRSPFRGSPAKPVYEKSSSSKPPKKSWIVFFAPIYAVGVCAYVLYMVYRITTRQRLSPNKNGSRSYRVERSEKKATFNQNELTILEKRLGESENAVDDILRKACALMKSTYLQQNHDCSSLDSSDLSDSSDDDCSKLKVTELFTTSSANNESHQDSTSPSEGSKPRYHRRIQHRTKKHFVDAVCDLTSSEEENSEVAPRVQTSFKSESSNSEEGVPHDIASDLPSESSPQGEENVAQDISKTGLTSLPTLTLRVQTTSLTTKEKSSLVPPPHNSVKSSLEDPDEKSFLEGPEDKSSYESLLNEECFESPRNKKSSSRDLSNRSSESVPKHISFEDDYPAPVHATNKPDPPPDELAAPIDKHPAGAACAERLRKGSVDFANIEISVKGASFATKSTKAGSVQSDGNRAEASDERAADESSTDGEYVCPKSEINPAQFVTNERSCYLVSSADRVETVAAAVGESIDNETEKEKFLSEKVKLMHTTKEVFNAMGEIREYIKERKTDNY